VSVPATAQAGRPLAIRHTVRNIGSAPAGAFVIRFYLSADDGLDSGDVLLGVRSIAGLAPGASSPTVTRVTVPATTVVPASYRIIAVADALGQQVELEESNNTMVSAPLTLTAYRPDILITALGAPAAVQAGRPIVISHTVQNAGPAAARTVRHPLLPLGRRRAGRRRRAAGRPRTRWPRRRRQQSRLRERDRARHD